jgi:phage I-like protein
MKTKRLPTSAIAACTFEIQADGAAIQLFPAGAFKARDGRPKDVQAGHWYIDDQIATRLLARLAARATDVVIDYEHQTLNSTENGLPAPAAGWFAGVSMEWREGQGLFATAVSWTDKASAMIAAKEYRYLSPVFSYHPATGEVLDLLHVGLTNYPAIDNLQPLQALAAARFQLANPADPLAPGQSTEEHQTVNREQLLQHLRLSADASDDDIQTALTSLQSKAENNAVLEEALATAKTKIADPSTHVPLAAFEAVKAQVAALTSLHTSGEVDGLVKAGMADGRLLPVQESWARELGQSNVAALKSYLDKTPAIAALKGQQSTSTQELIPAAVDQLGAEALAVCKAMGVKPEDYLATLKA